MHNAFAENELSERLTLLAECLAQVERNLREATTATQFELELTELRRIVSTLRA